MSKRRPKKRLPTNYFITYENEAPAKKPEELPHSEEREVSAADVLRAKKRARR